jgi:hypothetical protein
MLLYIAVCVCYYQSPGVAMRSELALLELLMRRALWVILALWVAALASRNKLLFRRRCLWLVDWGDFSSVTDILWTSYPVDRKQQKTQKLLIDNLTNRPRKNFSREIKTKREKSTDLAATIKATQRTLKWQIWTWETFRQLSSLRTARIQLSQRRMLPRLKRSKNYWNLTRTGFTSKYSSLILCPKMSFLQKISNIFLIKCHSRNM